MIDPNPDDYSAALGKVIANLSSLESLLRVVLQTTSEAPAPWLPPGKLITQLIAGDVVPLNYFTSWDYLTSLIEKYNTSESARGIAPLIDPEIANLRNALVHGRILSDSVGGPLMLIRFARPVTGRVVVEYAQPLTIAWLVEQRVRVKGACDSIAERLSAL